MAEIEGLVAAGADVVEILFRTPEAALLLPEAKRRFPACLFGAGTMLDAANVAAAVGAGADFLVSPGLTPLLRDTIAKTGLPHIPGVQTASEVMAAREHGYTLMKYYPAKPSNAPLVLADYANIFSDVGFVPTSGIDVSVLADYGAVRNVVAVGGPWMLPSQRPAGDPTLREQAAIFKNARARTAG
jgi:2-dehydro-3-deoxyphosphogluconate aldolase/(4S)-4-hydroxy-2-oxoglutarate aldolase